MPVCGELSLSKQDRQKLSGNRPCFIKNEKRTELQKARDRKEEKLARHRPVLGAGAKTTVERATIAGGRATGRRVVNVGYDSQISCHFTIFFPVTVPSFQKVAIDRTLILITY